MKIKIGKYINSTADATDTYIADMINLPGSPPIGIGETPEKAVVMLMYSLFYKNSIKDVLSIDEINEIEIEYDYIK